MGLDRGADTFHRERRVPGVGKDVEDQFAGVRFEHRRCLAVEIGDDVVTDVHLDQALQPVRRRGEVMEEGQRQHERLHGLFGIHAHP